VLGFVCCTPKVSHWLNQNFFIKLANEMVTLQNLYPRNAVILGNLNERIGENPMMPVTGRI
jgi:hypothetical protein